MPGQATHQLRRILPTLALVTFALAVPSRAVAEWVTRNITVGNLPRAIGLNPLTNKVYVATENGAAVFVFEPLTDSAGEVAVGVAPCAIGVNPLTNRVYIANQSDNSVSVQDGATNMILATLAVGLAPYSIAINPVTNKIFVACRSSNSVSVIDGATNTVERTIAAGSDAKSVAVNPLTNMIYVANRGSANVTVINGSTWGTSTVTVGANPNAIAINPTTNYVYVANQGGNSVTRIDGVTLGKTTIGTGSQPYAIAADPVSNLIYTANVVGNSVTVINGVTNGATTVAAGVNPVSVAVNSATNRAYVCNLGSTFLTIIDGVTKTASSLTIGSSGLCAVANPLTGRIYVARNIGSGDGLVEIDGTTNQLANVTVGPGQSGVAVNRRTHRAYVLNAGSNLLTEVDLVTGSAGPLIGVGATPSAIVVDELRDRVYVANRGDNSVSVIDGVTRATSSVPVGAEPRALAIDPRGDRVFVANSASNDVTVIEGTALTTRTVAVGLGPFALAYDPVGDACVVANRLSNTATLVDATTLATRTVDVGVSPAGVAVDPVTHRYFVSNTGRPFPATFPRHVTVIDGATFLRQCNVPVTGIPVALAVDAVRGQVFAADSAGQTVTRILESDWSTRAIPVSAQPVALALNPWSDRLYVGCLDSPLVSVVDLNGLGTTSLTLPSDVAGIAVDDQIDRAIVALTLVAQAAIVTEVVHPAQPLVAAITPLAGHAAEEMQAFSGTATSTRTPNIAGISAVFVARDSPGAPWSYATSTAGAGTPSVSWTKSATSSEGPGVHSLHAVALDRTGATLDNNGQCAAGIYVGQGSTYVYTAGSSFVRPPTPRDLVVVNVEVDWLVGGDHDHAPSLCELQGVQESFLKNGYLLNIELSDAISETSSNAVLNFDETHGWDTAAGDWPALENEYRDHPAGSGWHYCLFGHQFDMPSCGVGACPFSGIAELGPEGGGDEFLVSLGAFSGNVGTPFDRAGTFMHELGHNLGLMHSGGQDEGAVGQFKPNYLSVMSYRYQLVGVGNGIACEGLGTPPISLRELDYSHGTLAALDETALIEADGLGWGAVDWDCSGGITPGLVAKDLSSAGDGGHPATNSNWCVANGNQTTIQDFDDWNAMRDFTCVPSPAGPVAASYYPVCMSPPDALTTSAISCGQPDPCVLTSAPGTGPTQRTLELGPAMPNPTSGLVGLVVSLPAAAPVAVTIQDVSGRRIATLARGWLEAGDHRVTWDGRDAEGRMARAGVYFVRLDAAGQRRSRMLVHVR